MATTAGTLPSEAGKGGRAWIPVVVLLLLVLGIGVYGYLTELSEGMAATGLRNLGPQGGATWGLYISFVIYFVGLSFAGISTAALIRLARIDRLRPIVRMAELLTVICLMLAAMTIVADLGQPLRGIVNLFRYARPQSPFFGTFTLVISGYLFASMVYLYLDGRRDAAVRVQQGAPYRGFLRTWAAGYSDTEPERERHRRASFWLSIAIVPLLVTAHSTLGFVFGLQVGRPGWYSALQAPAFVMLAAVSGLGMLIVLAAIARRSLHFQDRLDLPMFRTLGIFLFVSLLVYLYFVGVELLTNLYTGSVRERDVMRELLGGDYSWLYWSAIAGFVIAAALLVAWLALRELRGHVWPLVVAGVLVNLGAMAKRFLIVVPSQTDGQLLPYADGSYAPAWTEYAVVGGLIAFGALLFLGFAKVFPIIPLPEAEDETKVVT
jgi:molybdopterin-containing oxidoreductase family membrane subunit